MDDRSNKRVDDEPTDQPDAKKARRLGTSEEEESSDDELTFNTPEEEEAFHELKRLFLNQDETVADADLVFDLNRIVALVKKYPAFAAIEFECNAWGTRSHDNDERERELQDMLPVCFLVLEGCNLSLIEDILKLNPEAFELGEDFVSLHDSLFARLCDENSEDVPPEYLSLVFKNSQKTLEMKMHADFLHWSIGNFMEKRFGPNMSSGDIQILKDIAMAKPCELNDVVVSSDESKTLLEMIFMEEGLPVSVRRWFLGRFIVVKEALGRHARFRFGPIASLSLEQIDMAKEILPHLTDLIINLEDCEPQLAESFFAAVQEMCTSIEKLFLGLSSACEDANLEQWVASVMAKNADVLKDLSIGVPEDDPDMSVIDGFLMSLEQPLRGCQRLQELYLEWPKLGDGSVISRLLLGDAVPPTVTITMTNKPERISWAPRSLQRSQTPSTESRLETVRIRFYPSNGEWAKNTVRDLATSLSIRKLHLSTMRRRHQNPFIASSPPIFLEDAVAELVQENRLQELECHGSMMNVQSFLQVLESNPSLCRLTIAEDPNVATDYMDQLEYVLEHHNTVLTYVDLTQRFCLKSSPSKKVLHYLTLNQNGRQQARDPSTSKEAFVELLPTIKWKNSAGWNDEMIKWHSIIYGLLLEAPGLWSE